MHAQLWIIYRILNHFEATRRLSYSKTRAKAFFQAYENEERYYLFYRDFLFRLLEGMELQRNHTLLTTFPVLISIS